MTGLSVSDVLEKTESEISTLVAIGEEVYRQNQQYNNLLLDLLDIQLGTIAHLINNAHYKPEKFKTFLFLNHSKNSGKIKKLSDAESAIDAEIQVKASQLAKSITQKKAGKFINSITTQ